MSFEVSADHYRRFMGRYSGPLAARFADWVALTSGQRVLDVGCGPGALTAIVVDRVGVEQVAAADPSASFVKSVRTQFPAMDVRRCAAEHMPFPDGSFDVVLAQLVVHFMADPLAGITEMARTAAAGGLVAANVWDSAGGRGPLDPFWAAVRTLDPAVADESGRPGTREGELGQLFRDAGLTRVAASTLTVRVQHASFEDWWQPFTLGVGPAGTYLASLDDAGVRGVREGCQASLPHGRFTTQATAWTVSGRT